MKKLVLILAVVLVWSFDTLAKPTVVLHEGGSNDEPSITSSSGKSAVSSVSSSNRDCVQYTGAQAVAATSKNGANTVGIVFSGKTSRRGNTNADCVTAPKPVVEEPATNTSGGNSESHHEENKVELGGHSG